MSRLKNIKKNLQRVPLLLGTLCVIMMFPTLSKAQDTIKQTFNQQIKTTTSQNNTHKIPKKLISLDINSTAQTEQKPNLKIVNKTNTDTSVLLVKQHSPKRALWYSAVLPGLGQIYNKQAWKIPIIYAGAGAVAYFVITNYKGKVKFETEYRNRMNGNTTDLLSTYASYPDANIYSIYQSYNKSFQLSLICGGLVYALNILDAYVYGHLFDFEINEDITLHVAPKIDILPYQNDFSKFSTGLTFQLRF